MRTWFAKVVDRNTPEAVPAAPPPPEPKPQEKKTRRLVFATQLATTEGITQTDGIRIKAQLDSDEQRVVLMVDRPLLKGHSYWCVSREDAAKNSPLAASIFATMNPASVLIHEMNLTVSGIAADTDAAKQLGQQVRQHLESGKAVIEQSFLAAMPTEAEVRDGLQEVIDNEINPGIAAHSGTITLTAVKGNTAYIKMGGGCQGCAASSITLRQGIETAFRSAVPKLGALLDETDHTAGNNPFFTELPAGMGS